MISSSAFQNTALEDLSLYGNRLMVVPDILFIQKTLKYFNMGHNQMASINPTSFDEYTSLERLYLHDNQFTTPDDVSVDTLEHIHLKDNPLVRDSRLL